MFRSTLRSQSLTMTETALIPTPQLSPKALRTIAYHLRAVLAPRGSHSKADALSEPRRLLHPTVSLNGEVRYLSSASLDALVAIGEQIFESFRENTAIAIADMWNSVVDEVQFQSVTPRSTAGFVDGVMDRVRDRVGSYSYLADFEGIELSNMEFLQLGRVRIMKQDVRLLDAFGPRFNEEERRALLRKPVWLQGRYLGTAVASGDQFALDAIMTAGIVGVAACIRFQGAFSETLPSVHITARDTDREATVLRWKGDWGSDNAWGIERRGGRGQPIEFTSDLVDYLSASCRLAVLVAIAQASVRNELEECIARAIFWFARAQRDSEPAIAMLTLWSVVEAFYSTRIDDIAESLADGLSKLLTFGPVKLIPPESLNHAKARVKRLYGKRSKAAHRAEHRHVEESDLNHLGHWAAWCVISFAIAAADGITTLESARAVIERLADASEGSQSPS